MRTIKIIDERGLFGPEFKNICNSGEVLCLLDILNTSTQQLLGIAL
jgi:hypothetical protein